MSILTVAIAVDLAIGRWPIKQWQGIFLTLWFPAMISLCLHAAYVFSALEGWRTIGPPLLFLGLLTLINAPGRVGEHDVALGAERIAVFDRNHRPAHQGAIGRLRKAAGWQIYSDSLKSR